MSNSLTEKAALAKAWWAEAKETDAKAEAAWAKAVAGAKAAAAEAEASAGAKAAEAKAWAAEAAWAKANTMQWQPMTNWAVFEDRKEYLIYFANDKARYRTEVAIYMQGDAKPFACESNDYDRKMITYYAPIIQPDEQ